MIYNDVECVYFFPENETYILHEQPRFPVKRFNGQHLSLFSDINNCDYACPCKASLKEEMH